MSTTADQVGAVLVIGAGIAGIQASLDLAESGYYVYLVEKSSAIGGTMPMLDKTFPTNDCSMCILSPKLVECGRHLNIETITDSEVLDIQGEPGNFKVTISKKARLVDPDKCTACGSCAEECPVKVDDAFNQGLNKRKAIYKQYAQAYPNAYAIDASKCLRVKKPKACGKCLEVCQANAIDHLMADETLSVAVGSVILCPGFEKYDVSQLFYYGYGKLPNVLTSLEFERILSASGPFGGHLQRPSDGKEPQKIAWLQCVGSRNCRNEHGYCSSVCCMYAIKEALIAKEHTKYPLDTAIFFMDMRTFGKDFEKYYDRARLENDVRFIRSRVFEVTDSLDGTGNCRIRYANEDGAIITEDFDLVVLSLGLEPAPGMVELAGKLGLELNKFNFCETASLTGVATSKPGFFVAGAFSGPRDIPETVMQASAAAADSAAGLAAVRGTLTKNKEYPPEKDVVDEVIRTGVFICNCGINIGSVVNVPEVAAYAKTLPGVVFTDEKLYACSQDTSAQIKDAIEQYGLNRVVVASCSPRTHEPLFQETLKEAGLNPNLFEMANIRDQCSWVHMQEPEKATAKAKDLVKMAVYKGSLLEPIDGVTLDMNHDALVVGGGAAGMTAAVNLSKQGYKVYLVEKAAELGGIANRLRLGMKGEDLSVFTSDLVNQVNVDPNIKVYTNTEITDVQGFVGNFETTLSNGAVIPHGVTIIATGANEYQPTEYLYGQNEHVMTLLELEGLLAAKDSKVTGAKNVVFIQCVGSRDAEHPYCSRICCTKSVKQALKVKELNPDAKVFILYRDIRTYGFFEEMYREARNKGVIFIRYTVDNKPVVEAGAGCAKVTVTDHVLGIPLEINADIVGLAAAVVPDKDTNSKLSQFYKVPLNQEGFFLEAHMKLRPVDFGTDGVFMCGLAHGPKNLEENISQAKAAVGRACTVLAKQSISVEGKSAFVNEKKCAGCGDCEAICPAKAVQVNPEKKVAVVNEALCKGCGACASTCRPGAINVKGCTNQQLVAMIKAL
ncbi:MAG: FAD-dependent oxidoreductase [Firmicutes bacterium]|nr:FAD-dependent oxidoreductase [Bacillota bacterium]